MGDSTEQALRDGARDEQALAERVVAGMMARDEFSRWLGIEVSGIGPGAATTRMRVRPEMANGFGLAHGGIAYALADSALAFASNTHGRVTVSIENSITYPAPVRVGDELTAVAEQETATRRLAFFRVVVRNQTGAAVSTFRGTVFRTSAEHQQG
ncbi:MAG TPA: hotdog fold thioesterase [Gemmatimonadaceae bacterium]|nr:hotdog fold thioesterase [Gemmatimonadaceae bacterium]